MAQRNSYQPAEKVATIRRHLVEGVPVSDLCDEIGVQPTQYYQWQKQFFENGEKAFERPNQGKAEKNQYQRRIQQLEQKIVEKNEVVAELLQEHVQLKKANGEL
jgi:transposase-like protein